MKIFIVNFYYLSKNFYYKKNSNSSSVEIVEVQHVDFICQLFNKTNWRNFSRLEAYQCFKKKLWQI